MLMKKLRKRFGFPVANRSIVFNSSLNVDDVDSLFDSSWADQIRKIQENHQYKRVLVPYIYNSAFLDVLSDVPVRIVDTHDMFTDRNKKLQAIGVDHFWFSVSRDEERRALNRASHVLAIQEEEAAAFRQMASQSTEVAVIKHFADLSCKYEAPEKTNQFGFIGSDNPLSRDSFLWFADHVLPDIRERFSEASCLVAGTVCNSLPESGMYKKMGQVEHTDDFYARCSFTINPVRAGTGLKIKTLESLEHGRPVITMKEGARGLTDFIGPVLAVCQTKKEFTDAVIRYLRDQPSGFLPESIQEGLLKMNRESVVNLKKVLEI